jgi:hypothetical protein
MVSKLIPGGCPPIQPPGTGWNYGDSLPNALDSSSPELREQLN